MRSQIDRTADLPGCRPPKGPGTGMCPVNTPYSDGTTHVIFEPLDFIARLVALVPKPRAHLTRYHGVFSPNSALRASVVPRPAADLAHASRAPPTGELPFQFHQLRRRARRLTGDSVCVALRITGQVAFLRGNERFAKRNPSPCQCVAHDHRTTPNDSAFRRTSTLAFASVPSGYGAFESPILQSRLLFWSSLQLITL